MRMLPLARDREPHPTVLGAFGRHVLVASILVAGASVATRGQAPAPPVRPERPAAISGVVTDASTAQPVAGAVVQLQGSAARAGVLTDAKGRFVFRDVPAGSYGVTAMALGYFASLYGSDDVELNVALSAINPERRLVLGEGQWMNDVRIPLRRPGSISGTVLDERGDAVVRRHVRLLNVEPQATRPALSVAGAALTDDRGAYAIGRLTPGRYLTVVLPFDLDGLEGQAEGAIGYASTFFRGARSVRDATTITLHAGEDLTGVDVIVQGVPARRVAGRVDGLPEAWANLRLALVSADEPYMGTTSWLNTAWVETDGTFAFPNVPVGSYLVVSSSWTHYDQTPPGHQFSSLASELRPWLLPADVRRPTPGFSNYVTRTPLEVGDTDLPNLVVHLKPGNTISGRVVVSPGSPESARRHEAGGTPLTLIPAHGTTAGTPANLTPDGTFSIDDVFGGEAYLRAVFHRSIKSIVVDGRDVTYQLFDFSAGRSYSGVVVTLADPATLTGVIRHQRATAFRAGLVYFPVEREQWDQFRSRSSRFGFVPAMSDGSYTSGLIPGGRYYVVAMPDSRRHTWSLEFLEAASKLATVVDLDWGQTRTLDLQVQDVSIR